LEITEDTFLNGRISILQHRDGYRFSIDAFLLADFAAPHAQDRIVDLGTGCGIIPLILAYRHPDIRLTGIEIQKPLASLAAQNVEINRMKDRIRIMCGDIKSLGIDDVSGPVDLVISNPPYRKKLSGRINPHQQRAIARHEIHVTIQDVIHAASRLLRTGGRFAVIYPTERIADLLVTLRSAGIEPKHLLMIHSRAIDPSRLMLVAGVKGANPGAIIHKPLIIYQPDGTCTDAIQTMFTQTVPKEPRFNDLWQKCA